MRAETAAFLKSGAWSYEVGSPAPCALHYHPDPTPRFFFCFFRFLLGAFGLRLLVAEPPTTLCLPAFGGGFGRIGTVRL